MSKLPALIHDGAATAGMASLLYAGSITITALTALAAPTTTRRRAAREVLTILLRRRG
jgi:hypothetical protein